MTLKVHTGAISAPKCTYRVLHGITAAWNGTGTVTSQHTTLSGLDRHAAFTPRHGLTTPPIESCDRLQAGQDLSDKVNRGEGRRLVPATGRGKPAANGTAGPGPPGCWLTSLLLPQILDNPVDHHGQQACGSAQQQAYPCFLPHDVPLSLVLGRLKPAAGGARRNRTQRVNARMRRPARSGRRKIP